MLQHLRALLALLVKKLEKCHYTAYTNSYTDTRTAKNHFQLQFQFTRQTNLPTLQYHHGNAAL